MKIIFFVDFDGTITKNDTLDHLINNIDLVSRVEKQIEHKEITFKEGLEKLIYTIKLEFAEAITKLNNIYMNIDPYFDLFLNCCDEHNIDISIMSSNSKMLIKSIINKNIPIIANEFDYCKEGWKLTKYIDKSKMIEDALRDFLKGAYKLDDTKIIYIGNGVSDISAIEKLIETKSNFEVFAKQGLLSWCIDKKIQHRKFDDFSDIVDYIDKLFLDNMFKKYDESILLSPGVVKIFPEIQSTLFNTHFTAMHRDPIFQHIYIIFKKMMRNALNINESYTPMIMTGSGTSAMDMVISCIVSNGKTMICSNGMFGERWQDIGNFYNKKNVISYSKKWGEEFDLDDIEQVAKTADVKYLLMVHHDTSIGILNEVGKVEVPVGTFKTLGNRLKGIKIIVDAVSSFGVVDIDMENIDILITNPNKGLGAPQGIGIIVGKNECLDKLKEDNHYINLCKLYDQSKKNETTNTPCILSIYGSILALKNLQTNDQKKERFEYINKIYEYTRSSLEQMGLKMALDNRISCNAILTVLCDESNKLIEICRNNNIIIYPGKSELNNKAFQISFYGNDATIENIDKFLLCVNTNLFR